MAHNGKLKILNVDDNSSARYVITRMLRKEGFEVAEAATGNEALHLAAVQLPDLILLDVHLPDLNGFEVCRRLKEDQRLRAVPVMHLSATAVSAEERITGLEGGADAYLVHPVEPAVLLATVRALLRARLAEAEAREAANRWQATFDAISHGVCLLDRQGRVQQANQAMARLLGKPAAEMAGLTLDSALPGATEPAEGWPFQRAQRSLHRETGEIQAGERWFEVTADPLLDEAGRFAGAVRTVVEITGRRREEAEREQLLRREEEQRNLLEAVLHAMPGAVVIAAAPTGRIILANERFADFGQGAAVPADISEYTRYKLFHPDGRAYAAAEYPLARSLTTGEIIAGEEIAFERGDGTRGTLLVNSAPIYDRNGFIAAAVATANDISERKQLQDQFRQSQKMEAIGRLAGGVAHDFNNLLTVIGGYGQMVMDALDAANPLRKDMEAILEASTRATAVTRQLLTFSRRQVLQPKVLDLNRQVLRLSRVLRRVIGEDIELVASLQSDMGRIRVDPGQLEQVLLNLAVNARDAMPDGGKLTVETADVEFGEGPRAGRPGLPPGRYVLLSIADTGCGMSPEVLSHLFEPFFTTKGKGKGTGLGLSTVYGIVKQSGGEILVDSEAGRGTIVRVYFPRLERAPSQERRPREIPLRRGTETILIVEDEEDVRRLASDMLKRQGYAVLDADSGPEALKLFRQHPEIDMVLSDVIMPHMNGRELADRLRKLRPDLKLMFMSGYTDDVIERTGVRQTDAEFLAKPFTLDVLSRKVRALLDDQSKRGSGT